MIKYEEYQGLKAAATGVHESSGDLLRLLSRLEIEEYLCIDELNKLNKLSERLKEKRDTLAAW